MPPKFLENIVILCFKRRFSKQNSVIRQISNIFSPQNFWPGYTTCHTWSNDCLQQGCNTCSNDSLQEDCNTWLNEWFVGKAVTHVWMIPSTKAASNGRIIGSRKHADTCTNDSIEQGCLCYMIPCKKAAMILGQIICCSKAASLCWMICDIKAALLSWMIPCSKACASWPNDSL